MTSQTARQRISNKITLLKEHMKETMATRRSCQCRQQEKHGKMSHLLGRFHIAAACCFFLRMLFRSETQLGEFAVYSDPQRWFWHTWKFRHACSCKNIENMANLDFYISTLQKQRYQLMYARVHKMATRNNRKAFWVNCIHSDTEWQQETTRTKMLNNMLQTTSVQLTNESSGGRHGYRKWR